jgi:D-proline reductase (dithiol) PrdB
MEALEHREAWLAAFRAGWLAYYRQTGQTDWRRYQRPQNDTPVPGPGVDLRQSRLVLITSAGGYLRGQQPPFDASNLLGDYTIRIFPSSTPLDALDFAHEHYNQAAVREDPQVLVPLRHLEDLVATGVIGELAPSAISFMGYQPDATRTVDETAPAILQAVQAQGAQAALLVPA